MGKLLITERGIVRDADNVQLAENVIALKNAGKHWDAIDALLKAWAKIAPDEVDATEIQLKDTKEVLHDKKYAQTRGGKQQERRLSVIFPNRLMMMIRSVYKPDELIMDNDFFKDFIKRYPMFKVAEK